MKKSLLTAAVIAALTSSAFAQGLINFSGGTSAATRTSTNSVVGGPSTGLTPANAGGTFYYALFASANQNSINGSSAAVSGLSGNYVFNNLGTGTPNGGWELVGMGTNNQSAGRYSPASQGTTSATQGPLNGDNSLTVQGIPGAGTANIIIVGWEGTGYNGPGPGSTLASMEAWYAAGANAGWIGQSAVATVTLGDGATVGTPNAMGTGAGQVGGLQDGMTPPVPEPGTLALAAIGGASLLLFRRKK